ncbi:hypothetical protein GOBAR_AA31714 [Gossypium barbadense]|uniref:Uncharacterized protein n=1 Tax=Gossypium barbadense TaxID=3634 RepID=A0A2P5WCY2_GOSBA|nr:hypothetical protein GOBAR_AA31714 [Gossypium barbadense]
MNQQASIQGLETQIGQLAKLISERPQGNLLSNTETNPREQLNAITIQDEEGLVGLEPEPIQRFVETRLKSINEPCSSNNKGPIYEERRLQIEELDEWRTQKLRTHDEPRSCHDRLNVLPNQLKVGDKVQLDVADPHITTSEPNGAILFTVLNIFPYGTVEVTHSKFSTFKVNSSPLKPYFDKIDSRNEEFNSLNHHDYAKSRFSKSTSPGTQLYWKRSSTTAMPCSTTTIAITSYIILLAQHLWTNNLYHHQSILLQISPLP